MLVVPYELEIMAEVNPSLIEIRDALTEALQRLPEGAKSAPIAQQMREVVMRFLIAVGDEQ